MAEHTGTGNDARRHIFDDQAIRGKNVVAAIDFARDKNLRLVVKGTGHSYLGTSNAPDSLLVWTRAMNKVTLHDAFKPQGCGGAAVTALSTSTATPTFSTPATSRPARSHRSTSPW